LKQQQAEIVVRIEQHQKREGDFPYHAGEPDFPARCKSYSSVRKRNKSGNFLPLSVARTNEWTIGMSALCEHSYGLSSPREQNRSHGSQDSVYRPRHTAPAAPWVISVRLFLRPHQDGRRAAMCYHWLGWGGPAALTSI
jgi:hypothetical protein